MEGKSVLLAIYQIASGQFSPPSKCADVVLLELVMRWFLIEDWLRQCIEQQACEVVLRSCLIADLESLPWGMWGLQKREESHTECVYDCNYLIPFVQFKYDNFY